MRGPRYPAAAGRHLARSGEAACRRRLRRWPRPIALGVRAAPGRNVHASCSRHHQRRTHDRRRSSSACDPHPFSTRDRVGSPHHLVGRRGARTRLAPLPRSQPLRQRRDGQPRLPRARPGRGGGRSAGARPCRHPARGDPAPRAPQRPRRSRRTRWRRARRGAQRHPRQLRRHRLRRVPVRCRSGRGRTRHRRRAPRPGAPARPAAARRAHRADRGIRLGRAHRRRRRGVRHRIRGCAGRRRAEPRRHRRDRRCDARLGTDRRRRGRARTRRTALRGMARAPSPAAHDPGCRRPAPLRRRADVLADPVAAVRSDRRGPLARHARHGPHARGRCGGRERAHARPHPAVGPAVPAVDAADRRPYRSRRHRRRSRSHRRRNPSACPRARWSCWRSAIRAIPSARCSSTWCCRSGSGDRCSRSPSGPTRHGGGPARDAA